MDDMYIGLKKEFHIPDNHVLTSGQTKTKDRATFSIDFTEIFECDEQGNLIARYMYEERTDTTGLYHTYSLIERIEK